MYPHLFSNRVEYTWLITKIKSYTTIVGGKGYRAVNLIILQIKNSNNYVHINTFDKERFRFAALMFKLETDMVVPVMHGFDSFFGSSQRIIQNIPKSSAKNGQLNQLADVNPVPVDLLPGSVCFAHLAILEHGHAHPIVLAY